MTKYWKDSCLKYLDMCRECKAENTNLLLEIAKLKAELENLSRIQVSLYNMLDYSNITNREYSDTIKELVRASENSENGRVADCIMRLRVIANRVS